jgi:hypothetical protein
VERRFALHLPSDYKELIDALGPGSFLDLHVAAPDWPDPEFELSALIERSRTDASALAPLREDMLPGAGPMTD